MVYNPNPPFTPSDYGISGELDKDKLQEQLQDTRDYIAALGNVVSSDNPNDIANAIAALGNDTAPVYGEGVPEAKSYLGDKSTYNLYQGYTSPPGMEEKHAEDRAYKQMMLESLNQPANPEVEEDKGKDKDKESQELLDETVEGLLLPDLGATETVKDTTTITEMVTPDLKKKDPSFDGKAFEEFLIAAKAPQIQSIKGMERETGNPANPELAEVYEKLKAAGMTEDEMFKSAQYAGLTNVRTGKEGKSDYKQMIEIFENDFLVPQTTKKTTEETVDVGMDLAEDAFGKKFKMKDYKAALDYEGQDRKYIKKYLKDYIDRGGKVSDKVLALFPKAFPV